VTAAAIAPGSVVWAALAAGLIGWMSVLALSSRALIGPRRVMRWLLASWPSRCALLAAWGAAGWHIFCQRP
jgi:hypothetical protein